MKPALVRLGRRSRAALAALAAAVALAACSGNDGAGQAARTTLERIKAAGKIRVGYANEAPYAYFDPATGRLTGEAPEVARAVLTGLGVQEVEGVLTEFSGLIPGLKAGRYDMIAAGMYVLPARCREVAFSNPTYSVGEAFIVARGNPKRLHAYRDVARHADATIAVVAGAVQHGYARSARIPRERILVFPDAPSALAGVEAGRADAYAATSLTVNRLLDKADAGKVERAEPFRDPVFKGRRVRGYGAYAFRKEDVDLVAAVNAGLADFIGTAEHLAIVAPYGMTERELPGDVSAEALCRG